MKPNFLVLFLSILYSQKTTFLSKKKKQDAQKNQAYLKALETLVQDLQTPTITENVFAPPILENQYSQ